MEKINVKEPIGILTYTMPHRKTYDTLCLLKARGYENVTVFAKEPHYKKVFEPLIEHRPQLPEGAKIDPECLCKTLGFSYRYSGGTDFTLQEGSKILVCGAGIIPQEIVQQYRIINAHPGYIPNVRGLDALKWAIYEGQPIGVTTHLIGAEVDAGQVIERRLVPVFPTDTFHAVAQRQYEMEITMLVDAIQKMQSGLQYYGGEDYPVHKRMPHAYEMQLFERFDKWKKAIPVQSETE